MRTRQEHLDWCKQRAREYLNRGDIRNGVTSMLSDLSKHPETAPIGEKMGSLGMLYIINHDALGARQFVEGFR